MTKKIFLYPVLLLIISISISTTAQAVSAIERVELNAVTLGGGIAITLTENELSAVDEYGLFFNSPCEVTRPLSATEQARVAEIFADIDLAVVGTLERPSVEAASDGDMDTGLKFVTTSGEYESNSFDMRNPMSEYRDLVRFMYDQECTEGLTLKASDDQPDETGGVNDTNEPEPGAVSEEKENTDKTSDEEGIEKTESASFLGKITSFFKRLGAGFVGLF